MQLFTRVVLVYSFLLACLFILPPDALAQTPGLIYKPATNGGNKILDPNGDGYISKDKTGFPGVNLDEGDSYSEINYKPFPVFMDEPLGDLSTGPKNGHTDYSPQLPGSSPLAASFDGTNLLFRVRLAGQSTASKGYSILIDANNDITATGTNPGFEYEVTLASNFDVRIYYHGTNSNTEGPIIFQGSVDQYSQKSIAYSQGDGDPDYFYDFYVPLSAFNGAIPITSSTPLRMTGVTVTSGKSGLFGTISDKGGIDDEKYGKDSSGAFRDVIGSYTPTSPDGIQSSGFPPVKAKAPVVTGPIYTDYTFISGSSLEPAGSTITIYRNGTVLGTTTVDNNGAWLLNVPAGTLLVGDLIDATASGTGKTVSDKSSPITVEQAPPPYTDCATSPPTLTRFSNSEKELYINVPTAGTLNAFHRSTTGVITNFFTGSATAGENILDFSTNKTKYPDGTYWATLTSGSPSCTSTNSNELCLNNPITYPPTIVDNITTESTSITVNFTTAGSTISLTLNGSAISPPISSGTATSVTFNVSSIQLYEGDVFHARATITSSCGPVTSARSAPAIVSKAITSAPTITGSYCGTTATITGTSSEVAGTEIRILVNGVEISSPTGPHAIVNVQGYWSAKGLNIPQGSSVTARATAPYKSISIDSAPVTIGTRYSTAPAITTTPVTEGDTYLAGTAPAGTIVTLYINKDPYVDALGTPITVTTNGSGIWEYTGTNAISPFELYAGAKLTVTANAPSPSSFCESLPSAEVEVICKTPDTSMTAALSSPQYCPDTPAIVNLSSSEIGIIYNIYRMTGSIASDTDPEFGYSVLGNGQAISLTSYNLTSANDGDILYVRTQKVGASCWFKIGSDLTVGVYGPVPKNFSLSASPTNVCSNNQTVITVLQAEPYYTYQLINADTGDELGSSVDATGDEVQDLVMPAINIPSTMDIGVVITRTIGGCVATNTNANAITITTNGPQVTQSVSNSSSTVCPNNSVDFTFSSESGYTYRLLDKDTGSQIGSSIAGTNSDITLNTGNLSLEGTYNYQIEVSASGGCTSRLTTEPTVTVSNDPATPVSAGNSQQVCGNSSGVSVTLNASNPAPGTGVWSTTLKPTGAPDPVFEDITKQNSQVSNLFSGRYEFTWTVTTNCGTTQVTSSKVTITINCPPQLVTSGNKFSGDYSDGESLAVLSDQIDGGINGMPTVFDGALPPSTSFVLNPDNTLKLVVNTAASLVPGSYTFSVKTFDSRGVSHFTPMMIRIYSPSSSPTPPSPFPVQLVQFVAVKKDNVNLLQWITASERNNERFDLERSIDGDEFQKIGSVKGNGNSSQLLYYSFTDTQTGTGTVYYRLKQIDFDGTHTYSKIVAITNHISENSTKLYAYPNPFSTNLKIGITSLISDKLLIEFIDIQGRVVFTETSHIPEGFYEIIIPTENFKSGMYLLRLSGKGINSSIKLIKSH